MARVAPGTPEYETHLRAEIEHFTRLYETEDARESLFYAVPESWREVEVRCQARIGERTGADMNEHVVGRLRATPGARMLSLGAGAAGIEIRLAAQAPEAEIVCLDVNPSLLELGRAHALRLGLRMSLEQADLNTVELPEREFDLVFCHASLHHLVELEHVAEQVRRTLRPGGAFVVVDVVTRNGQALWPETRDVVAAIWRTLPARYRVNHTAYAEARVDGVIWESDTSADMMECIRSEDIVPVLEETFVAEHFVPYLALGRRFFDTMYGPNYDLSAPLDRAILDWIWALDVHYVDTGRLRPETVFAVYRAA